MKFHYTFSLQIPNLHFIRKLWKFFLRIESEFIHILLVVRIVEVVVIELKLPVNVFGKLADSVVVDVLELQFEGKDEMAAVAMKHMQPESGMPRSVEIAMNQSVLLSGQTRVDLRKSDSVLHSAIQFFEQW